MTVHSYLSQLSNQCIVRDEQKIRIKISIRSIQQKLNTYFGDDISNQIVFGSYPRNTILPRKFDNKSDVDLMIVFSDNSFQPQTYLDRLRRFVEANYVRSDIQQSHPTIQLKLNHICFELVPAVTMFLSDEFRIPSPSSDWNNWMDTEPNEFNNSLLAANKNNANLTKPIIRILKYWNAQNGYPFASYELEQHIVTHSPSIFLTYKRIDTYFYKIVETLPDFYFGPDWKAKKVSTLKKAIERAQFYENSRKPEYAELAIKKVIGGTS